MYHNKRVALIGVAPHLESLDQREYIESFDVVARVKGVPIPDRVAEKTSKRCDVVYCTTSLEIVPELKTVKEIRLNPLSVWDAGNDISKFVPYKEKMVLIHPDAVYKVGRTAGNHPNTGFSAMTDILLEEPKELYITGFTFFIGKAYYDTFRSKERTEVMSDRYYKTPDRKGFIDNKRLHSPKGDLRYFIKHIYPKVKVDNVLKNIVEEKISGGILDDKVRTSK